MKYITKEVRIGIAGIVALCVLIYGINWLKGIHMFQPSSYFYAKFENVNGLTKSSPVFADGVRVGIVRDIYYDYAKPGNVIVEVELDTELRIPKGSTAELVSELMGGVAICYVIGLGCKAYEKIPDKWIPVIMAVCGGVLGVAGLYTMPDFPAGYVINAVAVGMASGLAATGVNQLYKQQCK